MKKIYFLLLFVGISLISFGQTVLTSGDLAIIGLDTPGEDFSFVCFVDLDEETKIFFTDEEANGNYTIGSGEGTVLYTAPSGGLSKGTVVTYKGNPTDFTTTSDGILQLGNSGDGLLAYQGTSVGTVTVFLHAVGEDSGDIGSFPDGFSNYMTFGADDGEYNGDRTGTAEELMTAINDSDDWTTSGSGVIPFVVTSFTITEDTSPKIITSTSSLTGLNYTVLNGPSAEHSFTVEGSNLTNNISITAPTNYEISTGTGGSFFATSPITLTHTAGVVNTTTIYTRLKEDLDVNDYNDKDINLTSTGATSKVVTCSGTVNPPENPDVFSVSATSSSLMEIELNANSAGNNIVVVFDEEDSFTTPSGYAPSVGQDFAGGQVVYKGKLSPQIHSGLAASTHYYYKAWSVDAANNYSTGLTDDDITDSEALMTIHDEDFLNCGTTQWVAVSVASNRDWTCGSGVQAINGYGGDESSDDYLISPELNMDNYSDEILSFISWTKYTDNSNSQPVSLLYTTNYTNDPETTTWNELVATWSPANSQDETNSGDIDISAIVGANVRFAFRYQSSGNGGGSTSSWEIDDILIKGNLISSGVWKTNATTTNWNTGANWSDGLVPTAASNVVIPSEGTNYPIISGGSFECNDLTLELGSSLVIEDDGALTVNGTFLNAGGPGTLTIKSEVGGNGSFIPTTVSGQVEMERKVIGHNGVDADGWHLISQPVTDETFNVPGSDFAVSSPSFDDLYRWDEATFTWKNYKANSFDFEIGKGYLCAYNSTSTKKFVGWPNASDVTFNNLIFTNSDNDDGWFLLGNPFSSAIIWNESGGDWVFGNIGLVAQVFNSTNRTYEAIEADDIIPSMQGFFVEVDTNATGNITIPSSSRTPDNSMWYKSNKTKENTLEIKVTGGNVPYYDKTKVKFNDLATDRFDSEFDGHKLFGFAETPSLYTTKGNEKFSINTLQPQEEKPFYRHKLHQGPLK